MAYQLVVLPKCWPSKRWLLKSSINEHKQMQHTLQLVQLNTSLQSKMYKWTTTVSILAALTGHVVISCLGYESLRTMWTLKYSHSWKCACHFFRAAVNADEMKGMFNICKDQTSENTTIIKVKTYGQLTNLKKSWQNIELVHYHRPLVFNFTCLLFYNAKIY